MDKLPHKPKFDSENHWNSIYEKMELTSCSWYQAEAKESIYWMDKIGMLPNDDIIDIGGGDSLLVTNLLDRGFTNITCLDISEKAINRAKIQLGGQQNEINWIVSDVLNFSKKSRYKLWHDRACFHFLTNTEEQKKYIKNAYESIQSGGYIILSTFSTDGPTKCSGIGVQQYSEEQIEEQFSSHFQVLHTARMNHSTPSGFVQNFIYAVLQSNKTE